MSESFLESLYNELLFSEKTRVQEEKSAGGSSTGNGKVQSVWNHDDDDAHDDDGVVVAGGAEGSLVPILGSC